MTPLREHLQRLREPVEVDAIEEVVERAERVVRLQIEAVFDRIRHGIEELDTQRMALVALQVKAHNLNERTGAGKGLMATLRTSLANDEIEASRERASFDLQGTSAQLARRMERALAMGEEVDLLIADLHFAIDALGDLADRAGRGGLASEADHIRATTQRLRALEPSLDEAAEPLTEPLRRAGKALQDATRTTAVLKSTERAATFGEAALDGVVSRQGGAVSQKLRSAVGEAAPLLVPDLDRDTIGHDAAMDELTATVDGARRRARSDEDLRRAAEAELDALEWDP